MKINVVYNKFEVCCCVEVLICIEFYVVELLYLIK